jgi:uncharacterized metal-binding protein
MAEDKSLTTLNVIGSGCCGTGGGETLLVYSCSGNANVGQIANRVMVEVSGNGYTSASCLSGIGAGLSGFVESAKAGRAIVIDGCPTACGRKIFEKQGIMPYKHFIITELGIKKTYDLAGLEKDAKTAMDSIVPNL